MAIVSKKLSVVGLGYVGLPLALLAEQKGWTVFGIDIEAKKVEMLEHRVSPFVDANVQRMLRASEMEVSTAFKKIQESDVAVISVPTPVTPERHPDLRAVRAASEQIGRFLKAGTLVVLESTVNPGVSENVVLPILETNSGLKGEKDFYLAHCPERINPGDQNWPLEKIPRVVGALGSESLARAKDFYRSILDSDVSPMDSLKEAEAVKVVENAFRDINIAFVNELAMAFSHLQIDTVNVIKGASTKPFSFLPHWPGCGVGGHCIPVDTHYLIEHAEKSGFDPEFMKLARKINGNMPEFTLQRLKEALKERGIALQDARILVLGLSYKPDVDDTRESPALEIVKLLREEGAKVDVYDPYLPKKSTVLSLEDGLRRTDAVLLATGHSLFQSLEPKDLARTRVKILIDGRNFFKKEKFLAAGITYRGIGR